MRGSGGRFRAETGEHDHIGETNETKRPGRGRVSDQHGGHKGETRRATEGRVVFFAGFGFARGRDALGSSRKTLDRGWDGVLSMIHAFDDAKH